MTGVQTCALPISAGNATTTAGGTDRSVTYDSTAPTTTITGGPSGTTTATTASLTFTASETATFECNLDGTGWTACTSPADYTALADGAHTVQIRATDAAGNVGPVVSRSWTVDTTAPSIVISSIPAFTNSLSATFTVTIGADATVYSCTLDGKSQPTNKCTGTNTFTVQAGAHTYAVTANDALGNTQTVTANWTVDQTAPTLTLQQALAQVDPTNTATITFTLSAGEALDPATITASDFTVKIGRAHV